MSTNIYKCICGEHVCVESSYIDIYEYLVGLTDTHFRFET